MRSMAFVLIHLIVSVTLVAQVYIGNDKSSIKEMIQKTTSFRHDATAKNTSHNYLKFIDKYNEETWLFFFDQNNVCTKHKLISDYSNLSKRIEDLKKKGKSAGKDKWVFAEEGKVFQSEIVRDEWFFSILTHKIE